jgi:hypothetical protein
MKKTSGYFHLALNLNLLTISEECDLIMGLNYATSTIITGVPVTQAALQALVATVRADLGSRATDPHPALTKTEQQHVDAMTRGLLGATSDIVRQANNISLGNLAVFQSILRGIGINPAKPHAKHTRVFAIKTTAKGTIEIIVPSESGKGLGHPTYLYEYGIAAAEGTLPATWQPVIPLSDAEFYVSGIPSTSIVAVRYAVLLIPSHKKTSSSTALSKTIGPIVTPNRMLNILPVNAKGKVVLVHGTTFYNFSDVIYIVVS